ncbi:unnamed protein product [Didymodactylos carnosus]|uniref:WWE domain-containing protein n=1 Tax=Didymodactylos carnosus TaxID=1234261 RepID=A0A8S2E6R5_9BILA|nr:unnamed protein product [Didymodactylos carnosus]CAF3950719.1 unnamed protein product [Didymodactylos carnosus]
MASDHTVTWFWKSNTNPWLAGEAEKWTPYPESISNLIERGYKEQKSEVIIDRYHKIDIGRRLQIDSDDLNKQRPIRRCSKNEITDDEIAYRRERFTFFHPIRRSIIDDTPYFGSRFITDWLISFTNGTLKITASSILNALIDGITFEGRILGHFSDVQHLVAEIKKEDNYKKMSKLQQCCARLYTKPCFLFKIVNETLRDNDRTKLTTLGPFCYLVYNYIGIRHNKYPSIRNRLKQLMKVKTHTTSIVVYRGETLPLDSIETYRQAVGKGYYYKWSSFVSTSKSLEVAEFFGTNVLYIIEIERCPSNDQYVDLSRIAYMQDEEEILLRPGVRFKIESAAYDSTFERYLFHIQIVPSYISNIM